MVVIVLNVSSLHKYLTALFLPLLPCVKESNKNTHACTPFFLPCRVKCMTKRVRKQLLPVAYSSWLPHARRSYKQRILWIHTINNDSIVTAKGARLMGSSRAVRNKK